MAPETYYLARDGGTRWPMALKTYYLAREGLNGLQGEMGSREAVLGDLCRDAASRTLPSGRKRSPKHPRCFGGSAEGLRVSERGAEAAETSLGCCGGAGSVREADRVRGS